MKALVYEGPHNMPICDYPMCYPEAGQVKIKVKYCGICGSVQTAPEKQRLSI